MEKNKTGKYFKYAIGEIVLVVIGILIALQINNWNEERKDRILEKSYLAKIHEEFKKNQEQFQLILNTHKESFRSSKWILKNHDNPNVNIDTLRKHLTLYRLSFTYNPSKSSIDAIINSGKLGVIKDNELSNLLIEWQELIVDYQEEETTIRRFSDNIIIPFDIKHFTIYHRDHEKRFDNFFGFNNETKSEFLNIVATKSRMLRNIVLNPEREFEKINKALDLIISKTKKND